MKLYFFLFYVNVIFFYCYLSWIEFIKVDDNIFCIIFEIRGDFKVFLRDF